MEYLPLELLQQIFVRLPPKSIGRLKSVCKHLNSFLSSFDFTNHYRLYTLTNPVYDPSLNLFILCRDLLPKLYTYKNMSWSVKTNFTYDFGNLAVPIGSSKGLICLFVRFSEYFLWNPLTNESHFIIKRPCRTKCFDVLYYGFGYDHVSDDFKIVVIGNLSQPIAQIYTLRSNEWRQIGCPSGDKMDDIVSRSLPILVGHNLYWKMFDKITNRISILAFDLTNESFEIIPFQYGISNIPRDDYFICEYKACLCVCFTWIEFPRRRVEVWKMECREDNKIWKLIVADRVKKMPFLFNPRLDLRRDNKINIRCTDKGFTIFVIDESRVGHFNSFLEFEMTFNLTGSPIFVLEYTASLASPIHHLTPGGGVRSKKRSLSQR